MADLPFSYFTPAGSSPLNFAEDWAKTIKFKPAAGYGASSGTTQADQTSAYTLPAVSANPWQGLSEDAKKALELQQALLPGWMKMQQAQAQFGAEATRQQLADLSPYLSSAAAEATARNLEASTKFLLTKEQTPTAQALRNQIAQGQIASAASSEAARDQATAAQQQAATQFARRYAGQTFSTA
jgi:hypothetical protein